MLHSHTSLLLRSVRTGVALALFAVGLGVARPAEAKVRVVASIETLADLARQVGGDRVDVAALGRGAMDPHFVEAKPSLQVALNRADLLVHVGLDLEIGWLPPLVVASRNPRIQRGQPGDLDASAGIAVLDLPTTKVDRSQGDIHPLGNPHYWLPPDDALVIAGEIAGRLKELDPQGAATYDAGLAAFQRRLDGKRAEWERAAASLRGRKVVTYHKSWSYLSRWLGLVEVGYIEPKPGIPPPMSHVAQLVGMMRREGVKLVLMESFYSRATAQEVARLAGGQLVVLPSDVGATAQAKDYFSLVDQVVQLLANAAR